MGLKILILGESGSGKTCSLISLLEAGFNVNIADTDNNLEALRNLVSFKSKEVQSRLRYYTFTEHMRMAQGRIIPTKASMWPDMMTKLDNWKNDDPQRGTVCDLGALARWTERDVFVTDTLSALGQGALNFYQQMNGALGAIRTSNEGRRDIGGAQALLRNYMQLLNDSNLKCHVIVNTHITYVRADGSGTLVLGDNSDNVPTKGFPNAIGRAVSPEIPRYFGTVLLADTIGSGAATRRKLYTVTRGNINLKNVAPTNVPPEYDLDVGLAEYFKAVGVKP